MRHVLIFVVSCTAAFISLVAWVFASDQRQFELRGYVNPLHTIDLPYRGPRLGVNADLFQYQGADLIAQLKDMESSGFTWIRQIIPWDEVEIAVGEFDWSALDQIARAFEQQPELKWVPVIFFTPAWYRDDISARTAPPSDPEYLARFSAAFAQRYGHIVDHYQIWDEPNLKDAWGGDPQASSYLAILVASYQAIHATDLGATVLAAALAPTVETGPENISDWLFLRQLYQLGLREYSDAIAAKPYGFDYSPHDRRVEAALLNYSRIVALREIMLEYGDGRKALWASNWGWNALPDDWTGQNSIWGQVSSVKRTEYTLSAIQRAEQEWPWLGGLILEHWQPDVQPEDARWGFSLLRQDGSHSATLSALRDLASLDANAARNGLYHPANPYTSYSGLWTFGPLGADIGWLETSDSYFRFEFVGREIGLALRTGNYFAFLYPVIDGDSPDLLPRDANGNAYILLRSASLQPELAVVPVAVGLSGNVHTLVAVADRGWDQWAIAGFAVSDGDLSTPYEKHEAVAAFATIVALLSVFFSGLRAAFLTRLDLLRFLSRWSFATSLVFAFASSLALAGGMLLTFGDAIPSVFRRDAFLYPLAFLLSGSLIALQAPVFLILGSGLTLFLVFLARPLIGVVLALFWAPFFLFPVELYLYAFPLSEVLLYLTFFAWTIRKALLRREEAKSTRKWFYSLSAVDWIALIYVFLGLFAYIVSEIKDPAVTELRVLFLQPLIYFFLLRAVLVTRRSREILVASFVCSGMMVAGLGIIMFVLGQGIITAEGGTFRLASVYGSPNNLALYLERCLPFAITLLFAVSGSRARVVLALVTVTILAVLVLTQSVGALLLGLPASLLVFALLQYGRRSFRYLIPGAFILFVAGMLLMLFVPRLSGVWDLSRDTNFLRLRLWESSVDIIAEHPVSGIGLDQFLYVYRSHYVRPDAIWDPDLSHPHNVLLDFWIRLGIGGVAWLIAIQIWFWRSIVMRLRAASVGTERWIIIATGASMSAVLAHGLIDNSVFVVDLVYVFFFLLALATPLSPDLIDATSN